MGRGEAEGGKLIGGVLSSKLPPCSSLSFPEGLRKQSGPAHLPASTRRAGWELLPGTTSLMLAVLLSIPMGTVWSLGGNGALRSPLEYRR